MLLFNRLFLKGFWGSFLVFLSSLFIVSPSLAKRFPSLFQAAPKGALGDFAAPTGFSATASGGTVSLSWSTVSGGLRL